MPETTTAEVERQLRKHLPRSRDPILVMIKGHLLVEERLRGVIENALRAPRRLRDARLTFHQAACLCEGICGSDNGFPWRCVRKLNEVRNKLAHNLELGDIDNLVDSVIRSWDCDYSLTPSSQTERVRWLKNTIVMLCGILEGFRIEQAFMKKEMVTAWRTREASEARRPRGRSAND